VLGPNEHIVKSEVAELAQLLRVVPLWSRQLQTSLTEHGGDLPLKTLLYLLVLLLLIFLFEALAELLVSLVQMLDAFNHEHLIAVDDGLLSLGNGL
jgi:hypothetical protein